MKADYWNVEDAQVIEKTGHPLAHWRELLDAFKAGEKRSIEVIAHLQSEHQVPRYWARTITTWYSKQ